MAIPGRIPGTFGGGANTPDPGPAVPFAEPDEPNPNGYAGRVEGRIPGTYGGGANTPEASPAVPFASDKFPGDESAMGGPSFGGVCLDGWGYMKGGK